MQAMNFSLLLLKATCPDTNIWSNITHKDACSPCFSPSPNLSLQAISWSLETCYNIPLSISTFSSNELSSYHTLLWLLTIQFSNAFNLSLLNYYQYNFHNVRSTSNLLSSVIYHRSLTHKKSCDTSVVALAWKSSIKNVCIWLHLLDAN